MEEMSKDLEKMARRDRNGNRIVEPKNVKFNFEWTLYLWLKIMKCNVFKINVWIFCFYIYNFIKF